MEIQEFAALFELLSPFRVHVAHPQSDLFLVAAFFSREYSQSLCVVVGPGSFGQMWEEWRDVSGRTPALEEWIDNVGSAILSEAELEYLRSGATVYEYR